MAYVKVQTVGGQEFEHQVVDTHQNILVSEGHGKFQSLGDIYLRLEEEAEDQGKPTWEREAEVINDYFDGQNLVDVYYDRNYEIEDVTYLLSIIINRLSLRKSPELHELRTSLNKLIAHIDSLS